MAPPNRQLVVYLLTPTSNHNVRKSMIVLYPLYIFWLLHQTTTSVLLFCHCLQLYIFWLLHQTTTRLWLIEAGDALYIFWLLHQTTTLRSRWPSKVRCISFDSYIKPQRVNPTISSPPVVYLLTPTSNHNYSSRESPSCSLYIFWLLHQTTTRYQACWETW